MKKVYLLVSHLLVLGFGFALGIYFLPILTAPEAPSMQAVEAVATASMFQAEFKLDLVDSDFAHWGEGQVSIAQNAISLNGKVAPGPDYILYLTHEFVETERDFMRIKEQSVAVGPVKTFENFIVSVPDNIKIDDYSAVIIWCESFSQFITAAKYQ